MKKKINKVAIIGSGIMGAGIACHFANIGIQVLLLDICPKELTEKETANGLTLEHPLVKNRIVNTNLKKAIAGKPAPLYHKKFASRIKTGNLDTDAQKLSSVDWIIEVVVERLDIKQKVFELVEKHRKSGTLVSSNTSGIPIQFMNQGRSEDFQKHFAITHFFNPPRYLKLFEVIAGPNCKPEIIDFLTYFGTKHLGKTTVLAKDTPAFIGNRIGIFGIMSMLHIVKQMGLIKLFKLPKFVQALIDNKWLGSKTGQGFYKKEVDEKGKKTILALDLNTLEYKPVQRVKFNTLAATKTIDKVGDRFKILIKGKDKAGEFYRKTFAALFAYASHRVPEITDNLYSIDNAMKSGFGWQHGPFEIWDAGSMNLKKQNSVLFMT